VSLWVLSVLHDHNIQVNSRVSTSTSFTASQLSSFLQENLSLFKFQIEEDPDYRRIQVLQDAGLVPVTTQGSHRRHANYGT
jgi:hypothetical protein